MNDHNAIVYSFVSIKNLCALCAFVVRKLDLCKPLGKNYHNAFVYSFVSTKKPLCSLCLSGEKIRFR
jgi:hypothetical protein